MDHKILYVLPRHIVDEDFLTFQMISAMTAMKVSLPNTTHGLPLVESVHRLVDYLGWEDEPHEKDGELRGEVYHIWFSCKRPPYEQRLRRSYEMDLLTLKSSIFQAMGMQEQGAPSAVSLQEVAHFTKPKYDCRLTRYIDKET